MRERGSATRHIFPILKFGVAREVLIFIGNFRFSTKKCFSLACTVVAYNFRRNRQKLKKNRFINQHGTDGENSTKNAHRPCALWIVCVSGRCSICYSSTFQFIFDFSHFVRTDFSIRRTQHFEQYLIKRISHAQYLYVFVYSLPLPLQQHFHSIFVFHGNLCVNQVLLFFRMPVFYVIESVFVCFMFQII